MILKEIIESYNEKLKEFKKLKNVFSIDVVDQFAKSMVDYIFTYLPKSKELLMSRAGSGAFKGTIRDFFEKTLAHPHILESYILSIYKTHIRKNIPFIDFSLTYGKFLMDVIDYYVSKEANLSDEEKKEYISFLKLLITLYIFFILNNFKEREKGQVDPLTGVYTKNYVYYNFESLINIYKTGIFFDIRNFKEINLFYGYSAGDSILSIFSSFLEEKFNEEQSIIVRYGADDFLVFTNDSLEEILRKIENLHKSLLLQNIKIPTNYGITSVPISFISIIFNTSFIKNLDLNKFNWIIEKEIKKLKRESSNIKILTQDEINKYVKRYNISTSIIKNLKEKNVKVALQGVYTVDKKLIFKEALARIDIDGNLVTPFIFLEDLKDTNIEASLDKIVISKVVKFLKDNNYPFKISINISSSFLKTYLNWFMDTILEDSKLKDYLIIEIVEKNKLEEIKDIFKLFEKLNLKVFIDDFGSGYSNYDCLKNLNFNGIKIDGNIVKNVTNDELDCYFTECILKLAKAKDMLVIAEYVENKDIIDILNKLAAKLDYPNIACQGFYLEKPKVVIS